MKSVAVSDFRAHMPHYLELVSEGVELALTSRGREVARMMPPHSYRQAAEDKLKELRKTSKIGDILSPIGDDWKNNS